MNHIMLRAERMSQHDVHDYDGDGGGSDTRRAWAVAMTNMRDKIKVNTMPEMWRDKRGTIVMSAQVSYRMTKYCNGAVFA